MLQVKQENKRKSFLTLLLSGFILCIPALYNNFPFIYGDTGTYMMAGFGDHISPIRPATYGIFIRHVSLNDSLWLVIVAQALLVAWFIREFVLCFFDEISDWFIVLLISLLTCTTSIGITIGMLMPDFAASILILSSILILFSKRGFSLTFVIICFGLWLSIALHHSHFYILFLILGFLLGIKIIFRKTFTELSYQRLALVLGIALLGYFTIPTIHYFKKGEFITSNSGNVFLMGRFNQMGLLEPFLEEQCNEHTYSICKYKGSIPRDFLWDSKSPLNLEGTWAKSNPLYRQPVRDFLSHPYYLKKFCIKTIETIAQQLVSFNTVVLHRLHLGNWQHNVFKRYMSDTVPALENSLQSLDKWDSSNINFLQKIVVYGSALFLIYLLLYQQEISVPILYKYLAISIIAGLFFNATICSSVSMVAHRFQSRIIWLLPFFAGCLLYWVVLKQNWLKKEET